MTEQPSAEGSPSSSRKRADASGIETVVDDVFGFDFKLPRTLRDLVFHPGRVADDAIAHDRSRYMRPLRVFLLLSGLQLLIFGWLGINDSGTFSVVFADNPTALASTEARLTAAGSSLAEADEIIRNWTSWTSWPLIAISSFLYVLVIWATRPRLGLLNSASLYLVATNASATATLPLMLAGGLLGPEWMALGAVASFITLFVYVGVILHRRAADTALGLAMRTVACVLGTIPVLLVWIVLAFGTVELAFSSQIGLSRLELLATGSGPGGRPAASEAP